MAIVRSMPLPEGPEVKPSMAMAEDQKLSRLVFNPDTEILTCEGAYYRLGPRISHETYGVVFLLFEGDLSKGHKLSPYVLKLEALFYKNKETKKLITNRQYHLLNEKERLQYEVVFPLGQKMKQEAVATAKFMGRAAFMGDENKNEMHGILIPRVYGDTLNSFQFCNALQYLDILIRLAYRVCELHKNGIIHNDLHAQNILVTPQGEVTIIDYGNTVAVHARLRRKIFDEKKYPHLAPERALQQIIATGGIDVYSLGNILESTHKKFNFKIVLNSKFLNLINKAKTKPRQRISARDLYKELKLLLIAELIIINQNNIFSKNPDKTLLENYEKLCAYIDGSDALLELLNKILPQNKFAFMLSFGIKRICEISKNMPADAKAQFIQAITADFSWYEKYKFNKAIQVELNKHKKESPEFSDSPFKFFDDENAEPARANNNPEPARVAFV